MLSTALFSVIALFVFVNEVKTEAHRSYVVSLENFRGLHVGAGVLVDEDVVITSAHNIAGVTQLNVRVGSPVLGVGGQLIPIKKNCPVSGYNFDSRLNDIAVLRLTKKVILNDKVDLVKLPSQNKPFSNTGSLSGWGYNVQGGFESINVKNVPEEKCKSIYSAETVPDSALCVDYLSDKHSCLDSIVIGNPLVADGTVFGVVSAPGACDLKGYPALVSKILPLNIQTDIKACK